MERTLFNKDGKAVAYITDDYNKTIYLPDGRPVAYLYEEMHIFGINGRHLGWFVDDLIYDHSGERIGFTSSTCPRPPDKEPVKTEKNYRDEIRPRWATPPFPKLSYDSSKRNFESFLRDGQLMDFNENKSQ
jgi:hypothetical protein